MTSKKITSWGNNFTKNVDIVEPSLVIGLPVGNENSYGDAFMPLSDKSFKSEKTEQVEERKSISNMSIENFLRNSKKGLFGIPGKSNVTIGGAIASDTHGKDNVWGGSFASNVKSLDIRLPSGEVIEANDEKNTEIFTSTIGGYGLTGTILDCKLENNCKIESTYLKKVSLGEGIDNLTKETTFEKNVYWVGWIDLLSRNKKWVSEKFFPINSKNIEINRKQEKQLNISAPLIGTNTFGIMSLINNMFYLKNSYIKSSKINYEDVLYPLGRWTDTRNISKNRKIIQIQFSIPKESSKHLNELIDILCFRQNPILCSIKRISNPRKYNNFSFHMEGWTLAVDFPLDKFDFDEVDNFINKLIQYNGKIYLAKDSILKEKQFKEMYSEFTHWEKIVKKIDPNNYYQSLLSKRLGLKKW